MARKKKKQSNSPSMESSVKRLESLLLHPDTKNFLLSGTTKGVRQKLMAINFSVLRNIVEKVPVIQAIINTRNDQILPYATRVEGRDQKGFEIIVKGKKSTEMTAEEQREADQLGDFIENTGYYKDYDREDDFSDYLQMFVRDTLTVDQVATEIQYNLMGQAVAFWALDPTTIKRTTPQSPYPPEVRFVQEIDQEIYNRYSHDNMIFDFKNKRSDLYQRGYGYSPVEQSIDIVTTLFFGYSYARDQYIRDRIPKGFISVMGDIGQRELDGIQRYWYAAMSGAGGQWNIPVLPSGKDGVGMTFQNIGQSNRDMEYHKMMIFIHSICASVFAIDMSELGMKSDDSNSMFGDRVEGRISASKTRGLSSILMYTQQHINKILMRITDKYRFKFVGYDTEDEILRTDLATKRLGVNRTINEIRSQDALEPIKHEYADHVLNPVAMQKLISDNDRELQEDIAKDQSEMAEKQLAVEKIKAKKPASSGGS